MKLRFALAFLLAGCGSQSATPRQPTADDDGDSVAGTDESVAPKSFDAPGPCAFTTSTASVPRPSREALAISIVAPTQRSAPDPIVLIVPGFQVPASSYTWLGEHMASWCFVAILGSYVGGFDLDGEQAASDVAATIAWATNDSGDLRARIDASKVALIGHGVGGQIALLAALDVRPSFSLTVVGLDPLDLVDPLLIPTRVANVDFPVLLLGETWNTQAGSGVQPCAPASQNFEAIYASLRAGLPVQRITIDKANIDSWRADPLCGSLCDLCSAPPDVDHARAKNLTKKYAAAWIEGELRDADDVASLFTDAAIAAEGGLESARK